MLAVTVLSACTATTAAPSGSGEPTSGATYQEMTADEAKERMDSGEAVVIVDVRTAEEYETAHIEGAILIPNETISEGVQPERLPDLDAELLVYCRSGNRSKDAAEKLIAMGYTKVYDFGGINDWSYATVTGPEELQDEASPSPSPRLSVPCI